MTFSIPAASVPPIAAPEPVPQLLRDLVHDRTGIFFEDERLSTLLEKLEPRARAQGCQSYLDYYYLLKYEDNGPTEWRRVMDAFSVQETYFWRETDQVQALVERVVPAWFKTRSEPLKIWSAACATGEEPFSLAMALAEAGWGNHPIQIVASDASELALEKARAGLYRDRSFRTLPLPLREKYFTPRGANYQIHPEIAARVDFRWANLVAPESTAAMSDAPVVFCRNVFIYFSPITIRRVVASFAARMPAGSHLFVGASESLLKVTSDFELTEIGQAFAYVRKPHA